MSIKSHLKMTSTISKKMNLLVVTERPMTRKQFITVQFFCLSQGFVY